jgi:hypothetical protein
MARMRFRDGEKWLRKNVRRWSIVYFSIAALACSRQEAPQLQPAAPLPVPGPAPVAAVRDAAPDVVDAATDAGDARGRGGAKRTPVAPAGGGGGLKVEGSLSRADGDKVVRAAQGKLRACFEAAHPAGSGRKGRVSFKMTVDDRGHVTVAEIPTSTLPGGSDVETCMVHVLRDLHFARGSGESTVSFQMSFGR